MPGHLFRFFRTRQVLAQTREDRADALCLLGARGAQRILEPLARHEFRHRAADEGGPGRPLTQPAVRGEGEEGVAGNTHIADCGLRIAD